MGQSSSYVNANHVFSLNTPVSTLCCAGRSPCKSCERSHCLAAAPFLGAVEVRQRAAMLQDVMTDQTRKSLPLSILASILGQKLLKWLRKIGPLGRSSTLLAAGRCEWAWNDFNCIWKKKKHFYVISRCVRFLNAKKIKAVKWKWEIDLASQENSSIKRCANF